MTVRELKFLGLVIVIFLAADLETDIYLPAFPDMMVFFGINEARIQQLLTWNFVGICLSGPFYGPLSDAYGRRRPLLVALSLFMLGSIATIVATDFNAMLLGRVLQGLGSGGCFTLGTAIIFDAFQAERAVAAMNFLNSIFPFVLAGAPALGGTLNNAFGFRANFWAVAGLVFVSLSTSSLLLRETLPIEHRQPLRLASLRRDFGTVCTSLPFVLLVLSMCLMFSLWMAFLSTVSVLFVLELGVSKAAFPWFQSGPLLAWLLASLTSTPLLRCVGTYRMRRLGLWGAVIGGLSFAAGALTMPTNPYVHVLTMSLYAFGLNWFQSLYFPAAMELHPSVKGVAASVLTSARLVIAAVVVGTTSHLYNGTIYPLAAAMLVLLAIVVPIVLLYESRYGSPTPCPIKARSQPAENLG